jgi:hypothetical protein
MAKPLAEIHISLPIFAFHQKPNGYGGTLNSNDWCETGTCLNYGEKINFNPN